MKLRLCPQNSSIQKLPRTLLLNTMLIIGLSGLTLPARAQPMRAPSTLTPSSAAEETASAEKFFSETPFQEWQKAGQARQIPWKVSITGAGLGFHQRLVSKIAVELPGSELIRRRQDGQLILLVQVTDASGRAYRNFGILGLESLKPELVKNDVVFSWGAYALPGDYKVALALYDKKSGEHDFAENSFRVERLKNDPLPEAWQDEPSWEYWDPLTDSIDTMFRPDVEGRLHLPVHSAKPMHVEVLADVTPSDYFHGSYDFYHLYLRGALPLFKAFTQLSVTNGSLQAATLDLVQRRVPFAQDELNNKEFDWKKLKSTLESANGPGVVDVRSVQHGGQNPVFLRDEIVRRMGKALESPGPEVFIIVGSPMDSYSFQDLPPLYMAEGHDVRVFYVQYIPPSLQTVDLSPLAGMPAVVGPRQRRHGPIVRRPVYVSSPANVQKMLKPLKVKAFQVSTPEDGRKVLARILEEIRRP
jgi:hypothetical protein